MKRVITIVIKITVTIQWIDARVANGNHQQWRVWKIGKSYIYPEMLAIETTQNMERMCLS